jgi:low affinity Fe/Cu permease
VNALRRGVVRAVAALGTIRAILAAAALVVVWAAMGPPLHYSGGWQLSINTSTTIVTFLMTFCILFAGRIESKALHAKLDTIIEALERADNAIVGLEDQTEDVVDEVRNQIRAAAADELS